MYVMRAGGRILRLCDITSAEPLCISHDILVYGFRPPIRADLHRENGMDHDPDRVLDGVKFPVDAGANVSAATGNTIWLKRELAKVAHPRHRGFTYSFSFPSVPRTDSG